MASKFFYDKPNQNYYTYNDNIITYTLSGVNFTKSIDNNGYLTQYPIPEYLYTNFANYVNFSNYHIRYSIRFSDVDIALPYMDGAVSVKFYVENLTDGSTLDPELLDVYNNMYFSLGTDIYRDDNIIYRPDPNWSKERKVLFKNLNTGMNVVEFNNITKDMSSSNQNRGFTLYLNSFVNNYLSSKTDIDVDYTRFNCYYKIHKIEVVVNYNNYTIDNANCYDKVELDYDDTYYTTIKQQLIDFNNLNNKSSNSSKTIKILATKNNNKKLFNVAEINIKDSYINFNDKYKCYIYNDNNLEFEGFFKILNIVKNDNIPLFYEIQLFTDKKDFFENINKKLLTGNKDSNDNIDFSNLNTIKFANTIINSADTRVDFKNAKYDRNVLFPQIYYGYSDTNLFPAINLKYVVDRIFEANGYSYTSAFFNSNYFKQLYIPHHNLKSGLVNSQQSQALSTFNMLLSSSTYSGYTELGAIIDSNSDNLNEITLGAVNNINYNNQLFVYDDVKNIKSIVKTISNINYAYPNIKGNFDITISLKIKPKLLFNTSYNYVGFANSSNSDLNDIVNPNNTCRYDNSLILNIGSLTYRDDYQYAIYEEHGNNDQRLYKNYPLISESKNVKSRFKTGVEENFYYNKYMYINSDVQEVNITVPSILLSKDAKIQLHSYSKFISKISNIYQIKYVNSLQDNTYLGKPNADFRISYEISDFKFEIKQAKETYYDDQYFVYDMNTFFNSKLKQADIINAITSQFNLVIDENKYKNKDFIIEPFDVYYDTVTSGGYQVETQVWDLNPYKNDTEEENLTLYGLNNFESDVQDKNISFNLTSDGDKLNDIYQKTYLETAGKYLINRDKKEDFKIDCKFSPTFIASYNGVNMPNIYQESNGTLALNDYNLRIIYIPNTSYITGNTQYCENEGMYNRDLGINLEFGNSIGYFYNTSITNSNAYNLYYNNYFNMILDDNYRIIEKEFLINDNYLKDLKMNDIIKVNDTLYRIGWYEYSTNSNFIKFQLIKLLPKFDYTQDITSTNILQQIQQNVINVGGGNSNTTGTNTTIINGGGTIINNYFNNVNNYNNTVNNINNITNNTNNIVNNTNNTIVNNNTTVINIDESGNTYISNITGSGNMYRLNSADTILNQEDYQYFIYGDMSMEESSKFTNKGKLTILNGEFSIIGDAFLDNIGSVEIITTPDITGSTVDLSNYYTKSEVYNTGETYNRNEIDIYFSNYYNSSITDSRYVQISGNTAVYDSKIFENASALNDVDLNDVNQNKFATLKNVKEYSSSYIFLNCDL